MPFVPPRALCEMIRIRWHATEIPRRCTVLAWNDVGMCSALHRHGMTLGLVPCGASTPLRHCIAPTAQCNLPAVAIHVGSHYRHGMTIGIVCATCAVRDDDYRYIANADINRHNQLNPLCALCVLCARR